MRLEKYIVGQFSRRIEKTLIVHARRGLSQLRDSMLSGDDSPLLNVWDEICAQQQGERSPYWSAYEEIIDQFLWDKVRHLDRASLLALWTQTDDGFRWLYDHHADENGPEQVSVDNDEVIAYLRSLLLQAAMDEDNEQVKKYLYPEDYDLDLDDDSIYFCQRIVSGGQTGVDRAALDFAIDYGYPHGGWTPRGREAEDGPIPLKYQLTEIPDGGYRQRTKRNVEDSDGTLIINIGALGGGSLATQTFVRKLGRPCFVVQLDAEELQQVAIQIVEWLQSQRIAVLNIAGPRESKRPGIYRLSYEFLEMVNAMHEER